MFAVWHTGSGWKLCVWSEQSAGVNVWCSGVRQQQCESFQPINFGCQGGHILQMQDMVSTLNGGPKSFSRFGSILYLPWLCFFYHPPLFNTVYEATLKLLCQLAEVFEKPAEFWAWEHCLVTVLLLVQEFGWFGQCFLSCFKTPRLGTSGCPLTLEHLLNHQNYMFPYVCV